MKKPILTMFNINDYEHTFLELDTAKWHDIRSDKEYICSVSFPIYPSKISVFLKYSGSLEYRDSIHKELLSIICDGEIIDDECETYPIANIFDKNALKKAKNGMYYFEFDYSKTPGKITDLSELKSIPPEISERYRKPQDVDISMRQMLFPRSLSEISRIAIQYNNPDDGFDIDHCQDIHQLMEEIKNKGYYVGDCKAVSTFTTWLANSIGLPSRRILGYVDHAEKENNNISDTGHVWPEIFLPAKEGGWGWFLFDPALRKYLTYPDDDIYNTSFTIPRLVGKSKNAKIMINYE